MGNHALKGGLVAVLLASGMALGGCSGCVQTDTSCDKDQDCASDQLCRDNVCTAKVIAQCVEDIDCGAGRSCVGGVCQIKVPHPDAGVRTDGGASGSSSSGMAGNGVLFMDPTTQIEFGDPVLNMDIMRSALVRNDGTGPLTINAVNRGANTSLEFTITPSVAIPVTLMPGSEFRINVTFRLAGAVITPGYINILSDAGACTFICPDPTSVRLPLFSEFKGDKQLGLIPTTHDFGFIQQGMQSSPFNIVASNDGTRSRILTVSSVNLTGAGAANFQLDATAITLPALLSPGQLLNLPVKYVPLAMGTHQATLEVNADSDNPALTHLTATLNGRSVPTIDLSADPINFGTVQINQSLVQATTIHNNSNVTVTVMSASFANGAGAQGFYLDNPSVFPLAIPMGSTATVDVKFAPTGTAGPRSDALNFTHNLNATPVTAALSGIADPLPPPPGGPGLDMVMTFSRHGIEQEGCTGLNSVYNAQNMDLILEAGGGTCEKPTTLSAACPSDHLCTCSFGSQGGATWTAEDGTAQPDEPYGIEKIRHNEQGGDGTFTVKNRYYDDCSDDYKSGAAAFMQGICGYGDTPPLRYYCFPYSKYPTIYSSGGPSGEPYNGHLIIETSCLYLAQTLDGRCGAHSGSAAKTTVTIKAANGSIVQQKTFCRAYTAANPSTKQDVTTLIREQGFFRFGVTAQGVTELATPNDNCPE